MLVIGSVAAKAWFPDFREPADIDIWIHRKKLGIFYDVNRHLITKFSPQRSANKFSLIIDGKTVELGLYSDTSPFYLITLAQQHKKTIKLFGFDFIAASPKTLLTIKKSHLHFPIKWLKHIKDYSYIKDQINSSLWSLNLYQDDNLLKEAYDKLYTNTKNRLDIKIKPNLNMSNEDFFNKSQKSLKRKYIHDDIHKVVAFGSSPMYTKIKLDQNSAQCDQGLWDALDLNAQVNTVQEEAFVIALERYLIPRHENMASISATEAYDAFLKALGKITTTLSSGWFRDFIIENWAKCSELKIDYVKKFVEALNKKEVRLYA